MNLVPVLSLSRITIFLINILQTTVFLQNSSRTISLPVHSSWYSVLHLSVVRSHVTFWIYFVYTYIKYVIGWRIFEKHLRSNFLCLCVASPTFTSRLIGINLLNNFCCSTFVLMFFPNKSDSSTQECTRLWMSVAALSDWLVLMEMLSTKC